MIIFIYGTTGELIKIIPLLKAIPRKQYLLVNTVQQAKQLPKLQRQLAIKDDFLLAKGYKGQDLDSYVQVMIWLPTVIINFFKNRKKIRRAIQMAPHGHHLALVHGDTNTTVIGAVFGKLLRLPVGHAEAGLRSFNLLHPFPEELNRRIVSRIARIHFAPGAEPVRNLRSAKGEAINTVYNTVKDSIRLVASNQNIKLPPQLPEKYGIVSIHRNELLSNRKVLKDFLETLSRGYLADKELVFLDHSITAKRLRTLGYDKYLETKNISRLPKLEYPTFMKLLGGADFVLTDSGGLQEECAYLNITCVVHRKVTERQEGLGANVELTGLEAARITPTLEKLLKRARATGADPTSPTKIIVDYLARKGYINLPR